MEGRPKKRRRRKECSREYLNMALDDKIELVDVINAGSFGDIYLGRCSITGREYAVKFDKNETPRTQKNFMKEYNIMLEIENLGLFPKCRISRGPKNKIGKTVLVMEKLGSNIYELFKLCGRMLDVNTVVRLISQMIKRLEELHTCGYIHRDIKPENFCMGGSNMDEVYLIDFGLSRGFRDEYQSHKPLGKNKGFVGTPRYASKNAHLGMAQSRRDDLEAVGYMCVFLIKGNLPWQNVKIKDKKLKHQYLHQKKSGAKMSELCKEIPKEFQTYLENVRALDYDETPQYWKLIEIFDKFLKKASPKQAPEYSWESEIEFAPIKKRYQKTFVIENGLNDLPEPAPKKSRQRSVEILTREEIFDEPSPPKPNTRSIRKTPGMLLNLKPPPKKSRMGGPILNKQYVEDSSFGENNMYNGY